MGFFSSLLKIAAPIVSGFLGGGAVALAAPAVVAASSTAPPAVAPSAKQTSSTLAMVARGIAGPISGGLLAAPAALATAAEAARITAGQAVVPCPSGKNRIQTIVQTILPNGQVCEQVVLEGRPFLMRKDFVTAKRVRKLISKAKTKIIPTRREESEQTKLIKAVVTTATRNVLTGGSSHGGKDG